MRIGRAGAEQGMTWAEQELGVAPLGDARLSRRLVKLATSLAQNP